MQGVYENFTTMIDRAAAILGLERTQYEFAKFPEREMIVSVPVEMDDGTVTVFQGVINVDETLIKAARVLGANDTVLFVKVIFPATTPFIITAVRLGISVALTTLIAAESTGAVAGLGMRIKALSQVFDNAEMMFYIIVVGVIGMLAEKVLKFFERRLTSWQEKREI